MTRLRRKAANGFTLLELLVVLAIMAIVGVLAVPLGVRVVEAAELRADARTLAQALRSIQQDARARQATIVLEDGQEDRLGLSRDAVVTREGGPPLVYFPDGTSAGASLVLSEHGRSLDINVAWMTGQVSFGDTR
jgi:general secretion pathway protein H